MIDMRCIQANDKMITLLKPDCTLADEEHHKDDYIVYCVRNNVGAQTPPLGVWSGPRNKYVGAPTYYVWAPTCYAEPETIMSGPRLIMSEPLLLSDPRDNYVGAPFLLYWGSEIIMLGPDLSCEDPDLLCPGPNIIMWEPRLCWVPHLSCRDPEIWGPWLICEGRDNYVWAPIYDVGAPTYHVGAQDIMWYSKYLIFLITFIFGRCHCNWAATK